MEDIKNQIQEIKELVSEFRSHYLTNEQAVRTQLIEPILNVLGWKTSNPKFVKPNAADQDGQIPDYTLLKNNKTALFVEAKNLSIDLTEKKIIDQLVKYCFNAGIDFGVLTNGVKWLLFKTFEKNPNDRIIWQVDIENEKLDNVARSLISFSYQNIDTLDFLLKNNKLLDKGWKALISSSESIVEIISEKLLQKIKLTEPTFKIDSNDLKSFTKGKIEELFELTEDEEEITEEKNNEPTSDFSDVKDVIFGRRNAGKAREKISVTFPDGTKIAARKVVETFVETIIKIGAEKVKTLNIAWSGVDLISLTKDDYYQQHKSGKYWIMTHSSTQTKMKVLNEINEKLQLNLKIEIVEKE